MLEEFKKFALRGNVVDLAVGVIIGAAFGTIVTSLVGDIIMPVIGAISGGLDFSNYYLPLSAKVHCPKRLSHISRRTRRVSSAWSFVISTGVVRAPSRLREVP